MIKDKEKEYLKYLIPAMIGIAIFVVNILYLQYDKKIFAFFNIIALATAAGIPILLRYLSVMRIKEYERQFPVWLLDVAQNIRSGMTVSQAIIKTKSGHYGPLTRMIKRAAVELEWGISFQKILDDMKKKSGSKAIFEALSSIEEAQRSGGKIVEVFESVSNTMIDINKIKAERRAALYSEVINGYIIFAVFVGIILVLKRYLLPLLGMTEGVTMLPDILLHLLLIQSIFSGLIIGKMGEGNISAGLKHSIILFLFSYAALSFL